jgi:UDP-glucose 4-epimerase
MKVGILGCHGFIGSQILRRLIDIGVDVIGIDRYASIPPWRKEIIPPEFKSINGDILDVSFMEENLQKIDVIIFACGNPSPASASFDLLFGEELRIVVNILDYMASKNQNARLIFISSGGTIYGRRPHGVLCHENDLLDPISMYGVMKVACEKSVGAYSAQYGLKSVILRVANPYGIGQNPNGNQGLIPVVLNKLFFDNEIKIWGSGDIFRDYFFIEDLSNLVALIIKNHEVTGIYNVGSGKGVSTLEIINLAADIANRKPRIKYLKARPQDLEWNALSINKTCKKFGWDLKVPLEVGIRKMYEWIQKVATQQ